MHAALRRHLGTRKKIRVERRHPTCPRLNGYLLGLSETLGLMHCFDDFEPDGYTVFRLDAVTSVRSNRFERHWDRMLTGEGLLTGIDDCEPIELSSMHAALESINRAYGRLVVHCEDEETDIQDFYIGKVFAVNDSTLRFAHFDALGRWHKRPAVIGVAEITMLEFETPYLKTFWKYLEKSRQR